MISLQNIFDGQGFALTFAGMIIVFTALLILSLFISLLPRVLGLLQNRFPAIFDGEEKENAATAEPELQRLRIVAAIAFVLHHQPNVKR